MSTNPLQARRAPAGLLALWILLVGSRGSAPAARYENAEFPYSLELPEGWAQVSPADSPREITLGSARFRTLSLRIIAAPRPIAMSREHAEKLWVRDRQGIAGRSVAHKAGVLPDMTMAGSKVWQFGVYYRVTKQDPVRLQRTLLHSWNHEAGHVWLKIQADLAKDEVESAGPELDRILESFRFRSGAVVVESPVADDDAASPGPPAGPVVRVSGGGDPGTSDEAKSADPYADEFFGSATEMSEERSRQFEETFKANAESRSEAAKERARAMMGLGATAGP